MNKCACVCKCTDKYVRDGCACVKRPLFLDGTLQSSELGLNTPSVSCSVLTFTDVPNKNNATVLNHLIVARLSEGPSIPDPQQLHILRPLSTPGSYQLASTQRSFPALQTPACSYTRSRLLFIPPVFSPFLSVLSG